MKRNMDLIRLLLLRVEATDVLEQPDLKIGGYDVQETDYNLDLMIQAGLINGSGNWSFGGSYNVAIRGLTWEGHDFLDAVRSDSIWRQAKAWAQGEGVRLNELPFEVVKGLGVTLLTNLLKNASGSG